MSYYIHLIFWNDIQVKQEEYSSKLIESHIHNKARLSLSLGMRIGYQGNCDRFGNPRLQAVYPSIPGSA